MAVQSKKPGDIPVKKTKSAGWKTTKSTSAAQLIASVDPKLCQDALIWVLEQGHGLVITRTKDDTAVHLTLLAGEMKYKRICHNAETLIDALEGLEDV